jgi:hypothetical protein
MMQEIKKEYMPKPGDNMLLSDPEDQQEVQPLLS